MNFLIYSNIIEVSQPDMRQKRASKVSNALKNSDSFLRLKTVSLFFTGDASSIETARIGQNKSFARLPTLLNA